MQFLHTIILNRAPAGCIALYLLLSDTIANEDASKSSITSYSCNRPCCVDDVSRSKTTWMPASSFPLRTRSSPSWNRPHPPSPTAIVGAFYLYRPAKDCLKPMFGFRLRVYPFIVAVWIRDGCAQIGGGVGGEKKMRRALARRAMSNEDAGAIIFSWEALKRMCLNLRKLWIYTRYCATELGLYGRRNFT